MADWYNLAVIMPSGENSFYTDSGMKGEMYSTFISKELVEFTRKLFPLSHTREDTLIGGFSMGGYGAFINGINHSETFGSVIALSSAFILDRIKGLKKGESDRLESYDYYCSVFGEISKFEGSDLDPEAAAEKLKKSGRPVPKIYLACGTEDLLIDSNRAMRDSLTRFGYDFSYEEGPGEHNWKFWDCYIERAFDKFLSK
jgi:S-formylglutathione hydrolase FrmB